MKRFFGIINFILCLELIIGPNFPGLKVFSVSSARAETCPAGLVFDSVLNRCITSDQQAEIMNASSSCGGDKECYKRIAEEKLKEAESEGKIAEEVKNKGGLMGTGMKVAAIAAPLTVALSTVGGVKCMNASGIAMVAGGLAFTVGDFMANRKHKSCLKKIQKEWDEKKAAVDETTQSGISKVSMAQAQSEAFEMLAKKEECMESAAKMKSGFYAASTLAFGASAVLAAMELMNPVARTGQCAPPASGGTPPAGTPPAGVQPPPAQPPVTDPGFRQALNNSIQMEEYIESLKYSDKFAKNIQRSTSLSSLFALTNPLQYNQRRCSSIEEYNSFKEAMSDLDAEKDHTLLDYLKMAYQGMKSEFTFVNEAHAGLIPINMNSPEVRLVLSGILAGMSAMMWMHARKQAKVAASRADFLRKMKEDFNDSVGAISCTAEERSMSANANCYCYTEDGQRNQARSNSAVCQQLWTGQTPGQGGDYQMLDFASQPVCIAANGSADESCACKQTRSCMNSIPTVSGNLGMGAISVATNGMKPLNDLVNGQIGAGNINGAAALNSAAKLLDQKNKLVDKGRLNPNGKLSKLSKKIQDALTAASAGVQSPLLGSSPSPFPMNMSGADAARELEKEFGGRTFEKVNGSPAIAQPGNSKAVDDSAFSIGSPDAIATTDQQVAEVMAQDFNYNNNDITKSDSNLFDILSNRYQRSGMRRLFTDDGKASPEPANKNDISP